MVNSENVELLLSSYFLTRFITTKSILNYSHLFCFHPQKISPWVGLRKINISYWGWDDMSPFTNTTLQWLPGEPNDSGFCAYLERAEVAGLKANPCTAMADGLVCEKPVGKEPLTPRNWCCGE